MDFERIRREMEYKARQKACRKTGSYEVTLEEIYEEIEKWTGIAKDKGMESEIQTELQFCFANPYMLEVYRGLCEKRKKTGKKIICVLDMYLPAEVLKKMLIKYGYEQFDGVFISCE